MASTELQPEAASNGSQLTEVVTDHQPPAESEELTRKGLPESWQFSHGLEYISDPIAIERIKHIGVITTSYALLEDGSLYRIQDGVPSHQRFDQADIKTTPYLTRDDNGLNRHHQIKDLELGQRTLLISREQMWKGKLSQARTAHNMLVIAKEILGQTGDVDPVNMEARGISRAAMLAILAKALSQNNPDYDVNIFYFNATAPCYPRRISFSPEYLTMAAGEMASLAYHLGRLPAKLLVRYPKSLDLDPSYTIPAAPMLSNGQVGLAKHYLDRDPRLTQGYIQAYPDDVMGMGRIWREDYRDFPGVTVNIEHQGLFSMLRNGHLRVLSSSDLRRDLDRQERLGEETRRVQDVRDIDFQYVNSGED